MGRVLDLAIWPAGQAVRVPRRAIAAAVEAEIERGDLWGAAISFEDRHRCPCVACKRWGMPVKSIAATWGVNPLALRRVIRGRRYIRGLK